MVQARADDTPDVDSVRAVRSVPCNEQLIAAAGKHRIAEARLTAEQRLVPKGHAVGRTHVIDSAPAIRTGPCDVQAAAVGGKPRADSRAVVADGYAGAERQTVGGRCDIQLPVRARIREK